MSELKIPTAADTFEGAVAWAKSAQMGGTRTIWQRVTAYKAVTTVEEIP